MSSTQELLDLETIRVELCSTGLREINSSPGEKLIHPFMAAKVLTEILGKKDREHLVTLCLRWTSRQRQS